MNKPIIKIISLVMIFAFFASEFAWAGSNIRVQQAGANGTGVEIEDEIRLQADNAQGAASPAPTAGSSINADGSGKPKDVIIGEGYAKIGKIWYLPAGLSALRQKIDVEALPKQPGDIEIRMDGLHLRNNIFIYRDYGSYSIAFILALQRMKEREGAEDFAGLSFLEVGAGHTAILGITAARLGAKEAISVENNYEPQKITKEKGFDFLDYAQLAQENIRDQGMENLRFYLADATNAKFLSDLEGKIDVVMINMDYRGFRIALYILERLKGAKYIMINERSLNLKNRDAVLDNPEDMFLEKAKAVLRGRGLTIELQSDLIEEYKGCSVLVYKITNGTGAVSPSKAEPAPITSYASADGAIESIVNWSLFFDALIPTAGQAPPAAGSAGEAAGQANAASETKMTGDLEKAVTQHAEAKGVVTVASCTAAKADELALADRIRELIDRLRWDGALKNVLLQHLHITEEAEKTVRAAYSNIILERFPAGAETVWYPACGADALNLFLLTNAQEAHFTDFFGLVGKSSYITNSAISIEQAMENIEDYYSKQSGTFQKGKAFEQCGILEPLLCQITLMGATIVTPPEEIAKMVMSQGRAMYIKFKWAHPAEKIERIRTIALVANTDLGKPERYPTELQKAIERGFDIVILKAAKALDIHPQYGRQVEKSLSERSLFITDGAGSHIFKYFITLKPRIAQSYSEVKWGYGHGLNIFGFNAPSEGAGNEIDLDKVISQLAEDKRNYIVCEGQYNGKPVYYCFMNYHQFALPVLARFIEMRVIPEGAFVVSIDEHPDFYNESFPNVQFAFDEACWREVIEKESSRPYGAWNLDAAWLSIAAQYGLAHNIAVHVAQYPASISAVLNSKRIRLVGTTEGNLAETIRNLYDQGLVTDELLNNAVYSIEADYFNNQKKQNIAATVKSLCSKLQQSGVNPKLIIICLGGNAKYKYPPFVSLPLSRMLAKVLFRELPKRFRTINNGPFAQPAGQASPTAGSAGEVSSFEPDSTAARALGEAL